MNADVIVVLDNGQMVGAGRHAELAQMCPHLSNGYVESAVGCRFEGGGCRCVVFKVAVVAAVGA